MPWQQASDESSIIVIIVVVAPIEERVAIVAMKTEVASGLDLESAPGVPARLSGFEIRFVGPFQQFHFPSIPTPAAKQKRRDAGGAHPQQQRQLNRRLGDLLVERLERL